MENSLGKRSPSRTPIPSRAFRSQTAHRCWKAMCRNSMHRSSRGCSTPAPRSSANRFASTSPSLVARPRVHRVQFITRAPGATPPADLRLAPVHWSPLARSIWRPAATRPVQSGYLHRSPVSWVSSRPGALFPIPASWAWIRRSIMPDRSRRASPTMRCFWK